MKHFSKYAFINAYFEKCSVYIYILYRVYLYNILLILYLYMDVSGLQELIDKILQLEAHNEQLKLTITKRTDTKMKKKETSGKVRKSFDFSR